MCFCMSGKRCYMHLNGLNAIVVSCQHGLIASGVKYFEMHLEMLCKDWKWF